MSTRQQKLSAFRLQEYGPDGPSLRTLRKSSPELRSALI